MKMDLLEGDPTQAAVVNYAFKLQLPKNELLAKSRVSEIPFDSGRKLMTTLHKKLKVVTSSTPQEHRMLLFPYALIISKTDRFIH